LQQEVCALKILANYVV